MVFKLKELDVMFMEEVDLKVRYKYERLWIIGEWIVFFGFILVGVIFVIVGIVLFVVVSFVVKKCLNGEFNNGEGGDFISLLFYKILK